MRFYGKYILCAFTLGLTAISAVPALADDKTNFIKLLQDPSVQQLILKTAKQSQVLLENQCDSEKFMIMDEVVIYAPLEFDSSGKITAGAWKQRVSESGCGQDHLLNVVVYFDAKSNGLKSTAILPGTTRADFTLQQDSLMYAMIAASRPEDSNCESTYIADTEFLSETGEPQEGAKSKPWKELWTLSGCGRTAQVTMHFTPDKTGTTINTTPQETKFLPSNSTR